MAIYPSLAELRDFTIPRAEKLIADGAERIERVRVRQSTREAVSGDSREALRIMEETQALQVRHLATLRQLLRVSRKS